MQSNAKLRELLLAEQSFEAALAKTAIAPFTDTDRQALEGALLDAFVAMDREISRIRDPWINTYKVQELLFRFSDRRSGGNTGYLFTLNQDLFPERYLYNEHVTGAPGAALPGLNPQSGQAWFTTHVGSYSPAFTMTPVAELDGVQLQGRTCAIKLHGSFNWRTADGRSMMVVGTEKTAKITALPLLTWYAEIFRRVLSAGDRRLMIVGYGFGDEHINAVIADAIAKHGLRVFIWDTGSDLKARILAAPHGQIIWNGLISTATRPLIEVFPSNQEVTEEYRRICEAFFGQF